MPVWCATPHTGRTIHRFYDSCPFSPSGRYLALTRIPAEDRMPRAGEDEAEIVVVDLAEGAERIVARTFGWDTQLGAQAQWGRDDSELYFNDLDPRLFEPFGVRLDPATGRTTRLCGPVYSLSPDGRHSASPCLRRIALTKRGYGVLVPHDRIPAGTGAPADDGIFLTDLMTGDHRLLISMRDIVDRIRPILGSTDFEGGTFHGFHVKWNPAGDRLMFVIRWHPDAASTRRRRLMSKLTRRVRLAMTRLMPTRGHLLATLVPPLERRQVITLDPDGQNVRVALPWTEWAKGGHHPNWCPNGEEIIMNLNVRGEGLRFVQFRYDGANCRALSSSIRGSGHPTLHPDGRHILTDAYPEESSAFGDGTVAIRLIDLGRETEQILVRIRTVPEFRGPEKELRVDPHPAWDPTFTRIAFNACPDGTRRVYVADLSEVLRS